MTDIKHEFTLKLSEDEVNEFRQALVYSYNEMVKRSPNGNRKAERKEWMSRFLDKFDEADDKRTMRPLEEFKGLSYNSDVSRIHNDASRWNISDLRKIGENIKEVTIKDYDNDEKTVIFIHHPGEDWPRVYVGVE